MSYKTVLVHVNDERRAGRLISFAAEFAETHGAHLIGIFVAPLPVVLNEWPDLAIAEMIEAQRKAYREESQRIGELFRDKTKLMSKPSEWRHSRARTPPSRTCSCISCPHGRHRIALQPDYKWHLTSTLDAVENLILESGRPVLVVPDAGTPNPSPKRVTVAWNGRRSTRACFDALPIIEKAGATDVLWVDPKTGSAAAGDLPCAELAVTLARHGAKCEAKAIKADDEGVSAAIIEDVKRSGSRNSW